MATPLAKPSEQLVLDLINEKSSEHLTFNEIVFGAPAVMSPPTNGRNTRLVVNSLPGKAIGVKTVYYNRLDLALLFSMSNIDEVLLNRPEQFTSILQLLPQLNTRYGLALSASDVYDRVPVSGNTQTIEIRPTSFAYYGQLQVTVTNNAKPSIEDVVYLNTLEGLDYMNADITGIIRPVIDLTALAGPLAIVSGSLRMRPGYTPNKYWIGQNGEVTAGVSIRAQTGNAQVEPTVGNDNSLNLTPSGAGVSLMVSLELSQRAGLPEDIHSLVSRYDVSLFLRSTAPSAPEDVVLKLLRTGGAFQWVTQAGIPVTPTEYVDGPGSAAHLLHQARFDIATAFPEMAFSGQFIAGVVLTRKTTLTPRVYVPMVFNVN